MSIHFSDQTEEEREDNVPIAFAMVTIAGLCTAIGALIPFFIKIRNIQLLAKGLAFSAGIMIYLSFTEIYSKSLESFEDYFVDEEDGDGNYSKSYACDDEVRVKHEEDSPKGAQEALLSCTASIFIGMLMVKFLDMIVHRFFDYEEPDFADVLARMSPEENTAPREHLIDPTSDSRNVISTSINSGGGDNDKLLRKMGIVTAIAIAIHNFPEGLATFTATLDDPSVGATLAIAVAIHNIPEGICIALPVYYSTGSKWHALCWATLAGMSEPLGAMFGWLILDTQGFSDISFGIIFGICGGAMLQISFNQLIPQAFQYDPENAFTIKFVSLGFVVMAVSLILFV